MPEKELENIVGGSYWYNSFHKYGILPLMYIAAPYLGYKLGNNLPIKESKELAEIISACAFIVATPFVYEYAWNLYKPYREFRNKNKDLS